MTDYVTKPIPADKPPVSFVERPWGSFKQYAHNRDCTVSLMTVLPGQRLSLQSAHGSGGALDRHRRWSRGAGRRARARLCRR